jgi:hypothetical protein
VDSPGKLRYLARQDRQTGKYLDQGGRFMTIGKGALRTLALLTGTTATVVGLGAASALAATPLTVKVSGGGSYVAKAAKTVLTDGHVSVTCSAKGSTAGSQASGTIASGTHKGASPVDIGPASKLAFNNCTGPLGKVSTKIESLPYKVNVDSTTNSKGNTDGLISGVKVAVKMIGCAFTVTGSAPGYYSNSKHTLNMTPKLPTKAGTSAKLTVSGVNGCAGLVKNGDHPTYVSTYTLSRKVTIKSS